MPQIYCLPCRRSWVRIPSAASRKGLHLQAFLRAQSACASASGRTDSGLAAGPIRRPFQGKTPCLQVDSGSSEPKSFCGPAEGQVFCLLRPLRRLLLQRHDPADSARRRDTSGRGPWGPVRFQSGNRGVNLGSLRDPESAGGNTVRRAGTAVDSLRGAPAPDSRARSCAPPGSRTRPRARPRRSRGRRPGRRRSCRASSPSRRGPRSRRCPRHARAPAP